MFRPLPLLFALFNALPGGAQEAAGPDPAAALSFSRSISIPLNALRLFDQATDAWMWTFGREPGAMLKRSDRAQGIIEGTARINFRSTMLTGREESMGTIQYRVVLHIQAGECRTLVHEVVHTGNKNAPGGGMHLGTLTRGNAPSKRIAGLGRANAERLYAEVKAAATTRIQELMQTFEARLRANAEP